MKTKYITIGVVDNYKIEVPCRIEGEFTPVAKLGVVVYRTKTNKRKGLVAWEMMPTISLEDREVFTKLIEAVRTSGCKIETRCKAKRKNNKKTTETKE